MVQQYYVPQITGLSERELQTVLTTIELPACLLGGWAVHLHVNQGFRIEYGRDYIGSRDIDLGIHIDPEATVEELQENEVGKSLSKIEGLGYERSRFGFVLIFHLESGNRITNEEAKQYSMHEIFHVYIDILPDTTDLDEFEEAFGFRPPAEPLLKRVFENERAEPLSQHVDWHPPDSTRIVEPALLAAMKTKSLPDRDESHKRVKDLADLHALLWHVKDLSQIVRETRSIVTETDILALTNTVTERLFIDAATLLQIEPGLVRDSINRLLKNQA